MEGNILENSDDSRKQINELSSFPDETEKDTVYLENLTQDDIENDDIIIITQKLLQFQLQQMIDNYNSNSSQDSLAELLMSYKKHFKKDSRLMEVMRQLANSQISSEKNLFFLSTKKHSMLRNLTKIVWNTTYERIA